MKHSWSKWPFGHGSRVRRVLARYRVGRAVIHLWCILFGGDWRWHLKGIRREWTRRDSPDPDK